MESRCCQDCGSPISDRSRGRCRPCGVKYVAALRKHPPKFCIDCGTQVSLQSRGRCRVCQHKANQTDPEFHRRRNEAIRRKFQDPAHREKMAKVARRNGQKGATNPEHRAWLVSRGKKLAREVLQSPEVRAKAYSPEARARAGRTHHERWMSWCPEDLRGKYRWLVISKKVHAADARKIIEQEIAEREALRHVSSALEYLRHYAPVQVLENGYRYGNAILRPSEVIERARIRGWSPDRWAA